MKITILFIGLLLSLRTVASEPLKVAWQPVLPAGSPIRTEWQQDGDRRTLKVVNTADVPVFVTLATIEDPPIESEYYGVQGHVKYEISGQPGILEMWNHFPAQPGAQPTAHFSRTMSDSGLLAHLSGESGWREFRLPFNAKGAHAPPSKLVINLHFQSQGTVYLEPATLHEYASPAAMMTASGSWWPATWGGIIGGCAGAFFGCFGGLLGYLSGKGRAREFVILSSSMMIAIGVVALIAGITALAMGQPYHVYYPLLLLGIILIAVLCGARKQMLENYRRAEERRMAALDTLGNTAH